MHPTYRGRHIGYKLYKIAENYAPQNKIKNLFLISGKKSKKAQEIYYRNGWEVTNVKNEDVDIFVRNGADLYKKKMKE